PNNLSGWAYRISPPCVGELQCVSVKAKQFAGGTEVERCPFLAHRVISLRRTIMGANWVGCQTPKVFGASRGSAILSARATPEPFARTSTSEMRRSPRPSVGEPRRELLLAVRSFVRAARACPGVLRIALVGSLVTSKAIPKDADVVVTINGSMDLGELARAGRRLKGSAQTINLGADIFLADTTGRYLGRVCHYRECHPRAACLAQHCGRREHLNDDLHVVTLSKELLVSPPVDLWPNVIRRRTVPADVEELLLTELERVQ